MSAVQSPKSHATPDLGATPPRHTHRPLWLAFLGGGLLLALLGILLASQPVGTGELATIVSVPAGATARRVAVDLKKAGLIRSQMLFVLRAQLTGASATIKAGPYRFNDGMGPGEILRKLVAGDIYIWRFAVPEGYSIYQLAELLAARKIVTREQFLAACSNPELLRELGLRGPSVEGYLFPRTYDLLPGSDAPTLIRQMVRQFEHEFTTRFAGQLPRQQLSRHELVTLASLVEKEAIAPTERPLIAAVFLNRLKLRMRLQSDPTAIYGQRAFGGTISATEVRRITPYNTYVIPGLPPGPIGNPSGEAIAAVLNPAPVRHLYFVAKKDGTHHFSDSLEEHNRAVVKYLRNGGR